MDQFAHGIRMGYPVCCVKHFDNTVKNGGSPFEEVSRNFPGAWMGSGYVPCPQCAAEIEKIGFCTFVETRITPRRNYWLPFPYDSIPFRDYPRVLKDMGLRRGTVLLVDDFMFSHNVWLSVRICRFFRTKSVYI